jgi:hypothetical protein
MAMSFLHALVENPALVLRHRNIFLLSHMRANTSLFGHLLGSHPLVEGYYEMHIGYHSWKSLWRQKLLHFAGHRAKPSARWMFDKVLHDGHAVAPALLQREDSRTIVMLREPVQSIKSLMVLYQAESPHLPEATADGAARYYIDRLATLANVATLLPGRYFYLDAECLVSDAAPTLAALGDWLQLPTPIPSEYKTFTNTGRGKSGDTSSRLKSGKISKSSRDYADVQVPAGLLQEAHDAYTRYRATLVAAAQRRALLPAQPARAGAEPAILAP